MLSVKHGPICIPTSRYPISKGTSEDCLFLDVYSPYRASNHPELLPVFFYIQGGGSIRIQIRITMAPA